MNLLNSEKHNLKSKSPNREEAEAKIAEYNMSQCVFHDMRVMWDLVFPGALFPCTYKNSKFYKFKGWFIYIYIYDLWVFILLQINTIHSTMKSYIDEMKSLLVFIKNNLQ